MRYRIEIKWAVNFLIVSLLWVWVEKLFGLHGPEIEKHCLYTQLFIIPAILIYVFALREKRKKEFSSGMTYKQGLITGLYVSAFVTMLSPLIQYISFEVITPASLKKLFSMLFRRASLPRPELKAIIVYEISFCKA